VLLIVIKGFRSTQFLRRPVYLKAVTSLVISGFAPYVCLGDCNSGRVSISIASGKEISMELEILSPYELTDWMARSPSCTMVDKYILCPCLQDVATDH
jgi:hypothetical protein